MTHALSGRLRAACLATVVLVAACAPVPLAAPPPDALTLRELLALAPEAVRAMDADARSYWRHQIDAALDEEAAAETEARPSDPPAIAAAPGVALALPGSLRLALAVDGARAGLGLDPLVATEVSGGALRALAADSLFAADASAPGDPLVPLRAALDAALPGHGELLLFEAPSAPFALLVSAGDGAVWYNPVLLALADDGDDAAGLARAGRVPLLVPRPPPLDHHPAPNSFWGDNNPYRFYDSLAECAAAEEQRCAACLGGTADACVQKLGGPSGSDECSVLQSTADGWMLACIMYAYSMATVEFCMQDAAPVCAPVGLPYGIDALESYRPVLDDATCFGALGDCVTPYRDELSCSNPCSGCGNACSDCAGSLDGCSASIAACSEACTGCGDQTSSTASSCASACDSCAQISNDCNQCSQACAVVRPLPPAPLDPARAPAVLRGPWAALRNLAALILPPLALLFWRRRLPRRPAAGEVKP